MTIYIYIYLYIYMTNKQLRFQIYQSSVYYSKYEFLTAKDVLSEKDLAAIKDLSFQYQAKVLKNRLTLLKTE